MSDIKDIGFNWYINARVSFCSGQTVLSRFSIRFPKPWYTEIHSMFLSGEGDPRNCHIWATGKNGLTHWRTLWRWKNNIDIRDKNTKTLAIWIWYLAVLILHFSQRNHFSDCSPNTPLFPLKNWEHQLSCGKSVRGWNETRYGK